MKFFHHLIWQIKLFIFNILYYFIIEVGQSILSIFYSQNCYVCKQSLIYSSHHYLCQNCWRNIGLIRESFCLRCGLPLGGLENKSCIACRTKKFSFSEVRCACRYQDSLRDLILLFKHHGVAQLCYLFAGMIAWQIRRRPFSNKVTAIIPVPMFLSDKHRRGYNQAELLALVLSKILKIPCYSHAIKKIKHTTAQVGLTHIERKKNLVDAFEINFKIVKKLMDQNVLLVDDIFTTGSTAQECSHILKLAGIKNVYVATIARTVPH